MDSIILLLNEALRFNKTYEPGFIKYWDLHPLIFISIAAM